MTDQQDRRSRGSNFPSRLENPTSKIMGGRWKIRKSHFPSPTGDGIMMVGHMSGYDIPSEYAKKGRGLRFWNARNFLVENGRGEDMM